MKLSSINIIDAKQQHNGGFFIFNFTLKYRLGNVYIKKIHASKYLHIWSIGVKLTHCDFKSKFYAPVFLVSGGFPYKANVFVKTSTQESIL